MAVIDHKQRPEKPTTELLEAFEHSSNPQLLLHQLDSISTLSEYLQELLQEKGLKQAQVVRAAQLNDTFGYQIFKGQRKPSRDKLLPLLIALQCSVLEANRALRRAGFSELYVKVRRDAIIMYGLIHHWDVMQVERALFEQGEATLSDE